MGEPKDGVEKRRHPRHAISKPVRAKADARGSEGTTRDISAGGAAVTINLEVEDDSVLDIDIEDVGNLTGEVARLFDDGFAVRFTDLDDEEEKRLIDELAHLNDTIHLSDE